MAIWHPTQHERRGILGTSLVTLGSVALVADLAFFVESLASLFHKLPTGLFGLVPTLGLSLLNAARAVALDQFDYFSLIPRILVLFTAMVAVVVGMALLQPPYAPGAHADPLHEYLHRERETHNG